MKNQDKKPTWTSLILAFLTDQNDFRSTAQIRQAVGANCNQASAALIHLRRRQAIDCVIEPGGVAWWMATPECDDRCRHCDERTPEEPGSRHRRKSTSVIYKPPLTGIEKRISFLKLK